MPLIKMNKPKHTMFSLGDQNVDALVHMLEEQNTSMGNPFEFTLVGANDFAGLSQCVLVMVEHKDNPYLDLTNLFESDMYDQYCKLEDALGEPLRNFTELQVMMIYSPFASQQNLYEAKEKGITV